MRIRYSLTLLVVWLSSIAVAQSRPDRHGADELAEHADAGTRQKTLHFVHPLVTGSPSPDTKWRVDYQFRDIDNHEQVSHEHTLRLEAEYALTRSVSVEIDVPYVIVDRTNGPDEDHFGDVEIGLKLASFVYEQHGVVVGGGLELGLPTGDDGRDIGSDRVLTIEPFIDMGCRHEDTEIVAVLAFGIPTNEPTDEKDEVDLELELSLSFLVHLTPRIAGLFEIDASWVVSGHDNETVVNLTPGIIIRPGESADYQVGVGVSFPVSNDDEFDTQLLISLLGHF